MEEVIIKRKPKIRPQSEITPLPPIVPPPTFHELVYQSSLFKLKNKIVDERCKHILSSVMPQYS